MSRRPAWFAVGAVAVAVLGWSMPSVRARSKAIAVFARAVGARSARPVAQRIEVQTVELGPGTSGDLYLPGGDAPGVVVVPGGAPKGKDDPRVIRFAHALAGAGRVVLVPELELRHRTLVWSDVEDIVLSVRWLERRDATRGRVGLLGFSYGGSFCLLAAQDERISGRLAFVATFGAYYDLLHLVQGVTTGATTVDGEVVPWRTVPAARDVLVRAAARLAEPRYEESLEQALERHDPHGLAPEPRAIYDVIENDDPRRTAALVERLPYEFRSKLELFSPSTHIERVNDRLFILQSEHDPATPPAEARALHRAVPSSRLIVLRHFLHVNPPGETTPITGLVADVWGALRFASWVLAAQE